MGEGWTRDLLGSWTPGQEVACDARQTAAYCILSLVRGGSLELRTMIKRVMTAVILTAAVAATAGCQSTKQALGMSKVVPDEFRVVTMAPLVVPPE